MQTALLEHDNRLDEIYSVTSNGYLMEFADFVLGHTPDGGLPRYKGMNLMQIPTLISNIWVFDLRTDVHRDRLLVNFCGTEIEKSVGFTFQGKYDTDYYKNNPILERLGRHRKECINEKRISYSRRYAEFMDKDGNSRLKYAECLMFPCAEDGFNVDWAIGCAIFKHAYEVGENVFIKI